MIVKPKRGRPLPRRREGPWKTREWGMLALIAVVVVATSVVMLATTGAAPFVWLAGIATLAFLFFVVEIWLSPK